MSAGNGNGAHGFEFFKIQVDLTAEGLGASSFLPFCLPPFSRTTERGLRVENGNVRLTFFRSFADNYEEVASSIFGYITLLRSQPLPEWAFREVSALSKLAFRFKEQEPASQTASRMSMVMSRPFPRELLLSAPWICTEWLPKKIEELLGLMTPENGRIFLSAQKEIGGRTYGEKEKWYGTEYCIEPMSEKIVSVRLSSFPLLPSLFTYLLSTFLFLDPPR